MGEFVWKFCDVNIAVYTLSCFMLTSAYDVRVCHPFNISIARQLRGTSKV